MASRLSIAFLLLPILLGLLLPPLQQSIDSFHPYGWDTETSPRVLLLTAHPDDESMFFGPTISVLKRPRETFSKLEEGAKPGLEAQVFSLCLSTGDAEGLGELRRAELSRSLETLGIEEDKRWVLDRPDLKDDITLAWDPRIIAEVVKPYILQYNITTVLTFDSQGISSHPNHMSLYHGISHLLSSLNPNADAPHFKAYSLITVTTFPKYLGPISAFQAKIDLSLAAFIQRLTKTKTQADMIVFVSSMNEYWNTLKAQLEHRTQMAWFRWLYIVFSRYMWVNEWIEIRVGSSSSSAEVPEP